MIGLSALSEDFAWVETGPGPARAVLVSRPELMLVAFRFDKGAIGPLHSHPHTQASYVAAGTFDVTIADETTRVETGGTFVVAPDVVNGVAALDPGALIDSFALFREYLL